MPGSIGGFPVHNYGSDPLGKMGLQMLQSNLDWSEKQKLLERQALQEAAKNDREALEKTTATGDFAGSIQDLIGKGYSYPTASSLFQQNERARETKELERKGKTIENALNSAKVGESVGKSIAEILKVGKGFGEQQQKMINNLTDLSAKGLIPESKVQEVKENAFSAIMPILAKAGLDKEYAPLLQVGINEGRVNESYETIIRMEIAKNSAIINDPKTTVDDKASAFGKNKKLIVSAGMKPEEMKVLIGGDNTAFEKALEASIVAKPKYQTIYNPDGSIQQIEEGTGKMTQVQAPQTSKESTAHNTIEMTSDDGKTAWKMQFNPATKRYDIPVGGKYPKYKAEREGLTPAQTANVAHQLRGELQRDPYVKDYKDVSQKFQVMQEALKSSTEKDTKSLVAVDQALITLFNKMTDPQSVVRESEYARTPSDQALINRIKGKAYKVLEGGAGLTSVERSELTKMGQRFYKSYEQNYDHVVGQYGILATQNGLDPSLVTGPYKRRDMGQQQVKKKPLSAY